MKITNLFTRAAAVLMVLLAAKGLAQAPQANFSVSPNPVCAGAVVSITDLSTNSPTSWSYTLNAAQGPVGTVTSSVQNPTITYNNGGTKTITLIATNASGSSVAFTQTIQVLPSPNVMLNTNNPSTCAGNSVALSINTNTANTVSWSTGASGNSIAVSPTVTTSYSVTVTNTAGCSTTRTVTVTIGPPTVNVVSNPTAVCGGGSVTLSANVQGQPGQFTYTWSTSANTRTVSTNVPGLYSVSVTVNGCVGTQTYNLGTTTSISINAQATQTSVCSGNNTNLFATGANSYTWSTGTTSQVAMVTPTANTTYTVIGSSGTCTASALVSIVVTPGPTVTVSSSPGSTICAGQSVTLTASGANNYLWQGGGGGGGGQGTPTHVVTPSVTITYTVRGINQGCNPATATITIDVTSAPALVLHLDNDTICNGQQINVTASGALTYSWSNGSTTPSISDSPSTTTVYTVFGSNGPGCDAMMSVTENVVECTGIKTQSLNAVLISVYPNPSNGSFTIASQSKLSMDLLNETGQVIKALTFDTTNGHKASITGLPAGIYFLVGSGVSQKLIVSSN